MLTRHRFGRTGLQVPALTFGGGWVGGLLIRGSQADREAVLGIALRAGIDWLDTAPLYGNGVSEQVIGEWLLRLPQRERPRVSTKVNVNAAEGDAAGQIERSLAGSLRRLGLERVPLLLLHGRIVGEDAARRDVRSLTVPEVLASRGIADIMEGLRRQGLCDFIGLTGLGDPAAVRQVIESGRFDVAQIYYNLLNPTAARGAGPGWNSTDFDGLLESCAKQDMGVMGIRALAAGHLATSARHGREMPITANAADAAEEARARAVQEIIESEGGSSAQAALRFALACSRLSTVVIGIGEVWHLTEALAATAMGPLGEPTLRALEEVWRTHPAFRAQAASA
jgi:L-galactose dehydrogenase/L-glyceraldehyde 3-phosphate reductase